jgi:nucleotide-binding universal stress UspA family protein
MFKHILIPTDGSPVAAKAAKAGIAFARVTGARVTGYYAHVPLFARSQGTGDVMPAELIAEMERRSRDFGERCVAAIGRAAKRAGVPYEPLVTEAVAPHQGIVDAAKKRRCDAIFIASHGHGGLARLLIGSVTNKVLTLAKIPVVVFR